MLYPDKGEKPPRQAGIITGIISWVKSLPPALKFVLAVYIAVRITASMAAIAGGATVPNNVVIDAGGYHKPQYGKAFEAFFGVWERSDALWYSAIARDGYSPGNNSAAFFPLYPLLTGLLYRVTGLPLIIPALLVANIAFVLALYCIYAIALRYGDEESAKRTVWLQALFPGSLFLVAPYSEALFLACAAGAFLAAFNRRWWWAGILGGLAALTRIYGVLLFVPLVLQWLAQQRKERRDVDFIPLLLAPGAFFLLMAYWRGHSGDPLAFIHSQSGWLREWSLPWNTVVKGIGQAFLYGGSYPGGIFVIEAWSVIFALAAGVLVLARLPLPLSLYTWSVLLPPLVMPYGGNVFLSCTRFYSVAFPLFIVLAGLLKQRESDTAVKILFAALYGLSVALYVASQNMF
ncbi:MAG: hypothetical protein RDV48_12750 [Candidatus Eremiobacteraeota bacterium]|nr:hypothetical protein [Candidatus Eremiobacteraeota bacterium]